MNWKEHITTDSEVLSGKPIIKGTRLSIEFLIGRLADGWTEEEILENYPALNRTSLQAVHAYTYDLIQGGLMYIPSSTEAA